MMTVREKKISVSIIINDTTYGVQKKIYLRHAQYASDNNFTLIGGLTSIWNGKNC